VPDRHLDVDGEDRHREEKRDSRLARHCRLALLVSGHEQATYDEFARSPDPDGWIFDCTAREEALLRYRLAQEEESS
jgi:hypothetical protein